MKLSEKSVNWAKSHIQNFYDSDFFIKPFEFQGIWSNWDEISDYLTNTEIEAMNVKKPIFFPSPKSGSGFRIVHQLDPLDSLAYTAIAYELSELVEKKRIPEGENVVFSYRIKTNDQGDFFSSGNGYGAFKNKSQELAESCKFVLVTDITDFYNQIYHHRLQNAIEICDSSLTQSSKDIEQFLMGVTNKVSRGVPVGPAASIIMAETLLNDIDEFILNKTNNYVRYVDDIRVFSNSEDELHRFLHDLTEYLYQNHRLTLSSSKTKIITADYFISLYIENDAQMEREAIHQALEELNIVVNNDYYDYIEPIEIDIDGLPKKDRIQAQNIAFKKLIGKIINSERLDLGLARHLLRRAKRLRTRVILKDLLENFDFFTPVLRDVMLYLEEVSTESMFEHNHKSIETLIKESKSMKFPFVQYWVTNYLATTKHISRYTPLSSFVRLNGSIRAQALLAINEKKLSWVRQYKDKIDQVGPWDRRAIIYSSQIMSGDEKKHWMDSIIRNGDLIDRSIAKYIKNI